MRQLSLQQRPILYKRQSDTSSQGQGKKFGSPIIYLGCYLFVSFTTLFSFSSRVGWGGGNSPPIFNGGNILPVFFSEGGREGIMPFTSMIPWVPKACSSYYPLLISRENRELDISFSLTGTGKCTRETGMEERKLFLEYQQTVDAHTSALHIGRALPWCPSSNSYFKTTSNLEFFYFSDSTNPLISS